MIEVLIPFFRFLRSLSFGGLVGTSIAAILFITFPSLFEPYLSFYQVWLIGAILGTVVHKFIDRVIVQLIMHPLGRKLSYYENVAELETQRRYGMIGATEATEIKNQMDREYFLGDQKPVLLKAPKDS